MPKRSRSPSPPSPTSPRVSSSPTRGRSASPYSKYSRTASAEPESRVMFCTLPPHEPLQLSADDFDAHYVQEHSNRCTACGANLPSTWMLELHIGELHNPLVAAERDKGEKTYKCFVEICERVCSAPPKRRLHMIDKHGYPREFDFGVVETGIRPGRTSLLKGGRKKSVDTRQEVGRKGGGLGKMTGRHARRRSSVAASIEVEGSGTEANGNSVSRPPITKQSAESGLDGLSSQMGSMSLNMTPRSVLMKKSRE